MPPTKILLLRHAEKPNGGARPPYGVTEDGTQSVDDLTVRGWQRAGALAQRFASGVDPKLPRPDVIFASGPRPAHKSTRAPNTVKPLGDLLGKTVRTEFSKGDEASLLQAILAAEGVVLVSWQHEMIPVIATMLLGDPGACPQFWPGPRFDVTWVLTPKPGGGWGFEQVPQMLLGGNSPEVIPLVR